eukprot:sb/3477840/
MSLYRFSNPNPSMPFCKAKRHPGECLRHSPGQGKIFEPTGSTKANHNSLFRSRDWLSANHGPVFRNSVGSWVLVTNLSSVNDVTCLIKEQLITVCAATPLPLAIT